MKKSIFLLFILLIACAPVATTSPSVATLPPSPTITPNPTATPEPTTTPSAPREADGNVQVFENNKWLDLQAPEGIWGPVDGTRVVLVEDGEGNQDAYTQMKLKGGFKDGADADDLVNVAKYNEKTKKWEVIDFTITRLPEELKGVDTRYYRIKTPAEVREISYAGAGVGLLGLKVEGDIVTALVLYKSRVVKVSVDEIGVMDYSQNRSPESVIPKALTPSQVVEMIRIVQKENTPMLIDVNFNMAWDYPSPGTEAKDCDKRWGLPSSAEFIAWCEDQILKGDGRTVPTKEQIEQALMFSDASLRVDDSSTLTSPGDLWDMVGKSVKIEGGWLRFLILEQR